MHAFVRWTMITAGVLATAAMPSAAVSNAAATNLVTSMLACKAETDNARRLACYDTAAGKLAAATAKGDVKVVDRADVVATRKSLFGFAVPKSPFFAGDDSAGEVTVEMDGVVKSFRADGYSKFTVTLDSGAVWMTTEPLPRDPKVGQKVHLRRGAIGSYFITINDARAARAIRLQ